jgi:hypothetical protein
MSTGRVLTPTRSVPTIGHLRVLSGAPSYVAMIGKGTDGLKPQAASSPPAIGGSVGLIQAADTSGPWSGVAYRPTGCENQM